MAQGIISRHYSLGGGSGSGKKYATIVVGTSTAGYTAADVDYLCDGTDDEVEINQALGSLSSTGGGKVLLLEGTYNASEQIIISGQNVVLEGMGCGTVINTGAMAEGYEVYTGGININNDGVCVRNLCVKGHDWEGEVSVGADLPCICTNGNGVSKNPSVIENVTVLNNGADYKTDTGIRIGGLYPVVISNCRILGGKKGIGGLVNAERISITNCEIADFSDCGVYFSFTNVDKVGTIIVSGNKIHTTTESLSTDVEGIYLSGESKIKHIISNNDIRIVIPSQSEQSLSSGMRAPTPTPTGDKAIYIGSNNTVVSGNVITIDDSRVINDGIGVYAIGNTISIVNNIIKGCDTPVYLDNGTGGDYLVDGNIMEGTVFQTGGGGAYKEGDNLTISST